MGSPVFVHLATLHYHHRCSASLLQEDTLQPLNPQRLVTQLIQDDRSPRRAPAFFYVPSVHACFHH
jgi:hypothetical protein